MWSETELFKSARRKRVAANLNSLYNVQFFKILSVQKLFYTSVQILSFYSTVYHLIAYLIARKSETDSRVL